MQQRAQFDRILSICKLFFGAASDFMIPCLVEQAEQEKRDWTQYNGAG